MSTFGGRRWYLVDSPELIRCTEKSREMSFDVFDVIQFGGERIIHVNSDEFPICFSLVEKCHCSKNFDLFDLSWISDFFANLANINWVIVAFCFGFRMCMIWILPCLELALRTVTGTREVGGKRNERDYG